jgi:hypothetical protein
MGERSAMDTARCVTHSAEDAPEERATASVQPDPPKNAW